MTIAMIDCKFESAHHNECHCHSWAAQVDGDECDDRFQSEIEIFASQALFCYLFFAFFFLSLPVPHSRTSKSSIMPQTTNLSFILSSVSWANAFALFCCVHCFLALFIALAGSVIFSRRWRVICSVLAWQGYRFWSQFAITLIHFQCVFWWIWFIGSATIVCLNNFLFWPPFDEQFHFVAAHPLKDWNYALRNIDAIFNIFFFADKIQKYILNEFQRFIYSSF